MNTALYVNRTAKVRIQKISRQCVSNRINRIPGIALSVGDVLQVYLDVESKIMKYGYNGIDLGVAFDSFHLGADGLYAAISMNLENECRFNFGRDRPFSYTPPPNYSPLDWLSKRH